MLISECPIRIHIQYLFRISNTQYCTRCSTIFNSLIDQLIQTSPINCYCKKNAIDPYDKFRNMIYHQQLSLKNWIKMLIVHQFIFIYLSFQFIIQQIVMKKINTTQIKYLGSTTSKSSSKIDDRDQLLKDANSTFIRNLPKIQNKKPITRQENNLDGKKKIQFNQILKPLKQAIKKEQLDQNYQLRQKIGEGAFALVKLAYDKKCEKYVVIKIYQKYKLYDKQRKVNVKNQIAILKNLVHPNIITLIEVIQNQKSINLIMQYFSSKSLRTFINETKLQQADIRTIIKQLASALSYLHQNSISHRDIKLQNVLIDSSLNIKLIDFGFSLITKNQEFNQSMLVGTPTYMCPQIINKKMYNPFKADIWALGILFYYISIGYFPYRGDSKSLYKKILKGQLIFPDNFNPGCQYLIKKMLNEDPTQRISAEQVQNDTWIKPINFKQRINLLQKVMNNKQI